MLYLVLSNLAEAKQKMGEREKLMPEAKRKVFIESPHIIRI